MLGLTLVTIVDFNCKLKIRIPEGYNKDKVIDDMFMKFREVIRNIRPIDGVEYEVIGEGNFLRYIKRERGDGR